MPLTPSGLDGTKQREKLGALRPFQATDRVNLQGKNEWTASFRL